MSGSSCRRTRKPRTWPDRRRHPGGAAGGNAARRGRRVARWHGPDRRRTGGGRRRASASATVRLKAGLGRAYLDGFGVALEGGATIVVQMDADCRTIRRRCPTWSRRSARTRADLVIGSRYVAGGGVVDWGLGRRVISRGGSVFARIGPGPRSARPDGRLQGVAGVDAGRGPVRRRPCRRLRLPDRDDVPRGPGRGAHREVPITFRDRRVGQTKMSRRIIVEALVVVVQLRAEESCAIARPAPRGPMTGPGGPPPDALGRPFGSGQRRGDQRPASGSSSTRGRSRSRTRAPLTAAYLDGCSAPMTPRPLAANRSRSCCAPISTTRRRPTRPRCRRAPALPPTHLLRSAALTVDSFLLRGASRRGRVAGGPRRGRRRGVSRGRRGAVPLVSGCRSW